MRRIKNRVKQIAVDSLLYCVVGFAFSISFTLSTSTGTVVFLLRLLLFMIGAMSIQAYCYYRIRSMKKEEGK